MPYQGRQLGVGVRSRFIYTAAGGQTTFSGADSNGRTLAYQDGAYVDVFLNGVCLVPTTDFTATTKTSISLISGATASDVVEIVCYDIATMADTVSKSQGGTFDGAVTVDGNFTVDNGTIKLDGNYPTGTGNVALGNAALDDASLTGSYNTAIGSSALTANTTATYNTAVGYIALLANTSGQYNTAIGAATMEANTTGNENAALGLGALNRNTSGSYNTALGRSSLEFNTTASYNVAVGRQAMYLNTLGASNSALGQQALYSNTTGSHNTALGDNALALNTTQSYNTAVGNRAAYQNTTGVVTAFGHDAAGDNTTGLYNTAIGQSSLALNTTSSNNTAVGFTALYSNTGGSNTAVGMQALTNNTTASDNTALGYQAGYSNTTGFRNVFIGGRGAGYSVTTGYQNTFVGDYSGRLATTGNDNTFLGQYTGQAITTASGNTFIGASAGALVTSGQKNTILGKYTGNQGGLDIRTSSNNIVLSDGDGNPMMYWHGGLTSPIWILKNPTTNQWTMRFENTASSNPYGLFVQFPNAAPDDNIRNFIVCADSVADRFIVRSDGDVLNHDNSYGGISDQKLKQQITDASSQWDDIKALQVRKYKMNDDVEAYGDSDQHWRLGVIAQELEASGMSGLVKESPDTDADNNDLGTTTKTVKYSILYMKAVKALQEAMERIETLEAKVTALENA